MNKSALQQAKAQAMRYCAAAERSPLQVREKLIKWDLSEEEVNKILEELEAENFVSEARFVKAFCHDKFLLNRWGKIKIKAELNRYQVKSALVEAALKAIDPVAYRATLKELIENKKGTIKKPISKQELQVKLVNFGLSRGFENQLIWEIIHELSF